MLINMGESYIVTNLPDDQQKVKLRVFSVVRAEQPDLFTLSHKDQVVVLGRSPNCDVRVDDDLLSKMQATIYFSQEQQRWVIQDGYKESRSTNGTWIYVSEEVPLKTGMLFKSNQTFFSAQITHPASLISQKN